MNPEFHCKRELSSVYIFSKIYANAPGSMNEGAACCCAMCYKMLDTKLTCSRAFLEWVIHNWTGNEATTVKLIRMGGYPLNLGNFCMRENDLLIHKSLGVSRTHILSSSSSTHIYNLPEARTHSNPVWRTQEICPRGGDSIFRNTTESRIQLKDIFRSNRMDEVEKGEKEDLRTIGRILALKDTIGWGDGDQATNWICGYRNSTIPAKCFGRGDDNVS